MYNNTTQYPGQNYSSSYTSYPPNYNSSSYNYQGYGSQYMNVSSQPGPPGESYPQNSWSSTGGYAAPPPSTQQEAVAQEKAQQKAQLIKQREDYVKKSMVLRRELDHLRVQRQDLLADGSSERDLELILNENEKLQEEIQGKMKAINNVIEMLSSIIKDGLKASDVEAAMSEDSPKTRRSSQPSPPADSTSEKESFRKYCYVHYDTGLHWCRLCDDFPETAKEFLLHLQNKKHLDNAKQNDVDNTPWHKLPTEPILESYEDAPKKRVPIKGLQFFISAPSWYCKLCDVWIGDLHCASHHLKSTAHFQNYDNFIQQNPQWEMDWLKDREKAMSRYGKNDSSDSDDSTFTKKKKKRKEKRSQDTHGKDKKKKKKSRKHKKHSSDSSSSSSSSDSSSEEEQGDKSRSIRVAMRNMKVQSIMNEDLSGKWSMLEKLVEEHKKKEELSREKENEPEDRLISQWMTVSEPPDKDKRLLDSLKDRMKQKQEIEKAKFAEVERKQREKENIEKEMEERKEREAQELMERAEKERKRREQEEFDRIRNKDRNQVRFRTREHYRRKQTPSNSDEEETASPREKRSKQESSPRSRRDSHGNGRSTRRRSESIDQEDELKKKAPGPPSYKKLPFIGRMPLFKNKKPQAEEKSEKEIKKEEYDTPRRTRFQPGNLARAFIPQPDVVCFPKLSSIPPLMIPPPPKVSNVPEPAPSVPEPPKISGEESPNVPPPPTIRASKQNSEEISESGHETGQYYNNEVDYNMYSHMYDFPQAEHEPPPPPLTMPLLPPPLPPDDDLALLGICADDMAAQSF